MEEVTGKEKRLEKYCSKSVISILAENSYKFITECFSPFTPFTNSKIKSYKPSQNQGGKQFERCEYKIACRPPIQLFKSFQEDKIKKNEENPAVPQKKLFKTNKATNKIFQHNLTDSESLKVYRDMYIYKSLGSVARKNLERAVAIYNANKDEIELSRRFSTKKNMNPCKREQSQQKKLMKSETYFRTAKPKTDLKEKLSKDLKRSLQGMLSNNKKTTHFTDNGKNTNRNTNNINKAEIREKKKDKNQNNKEIENVSKVPNTLIKKLYVKNDVKRILPQLPVRPIERKIKEKKQLTLAVLNISLPSLKQSKDKPSKDSRMSYYKNTVLYNELPDNLYKKQDNSGLEEHDGTCCKLSNRKRIVDIRGQLFTSNKTKTSKKRSYLLKLPINEANRKGLSIPSPENMNLLHIQEPDKTYTLPLPINTSLSMLSQPLIKEKHFYEIDEHYSSEAEHYKDKDNERKRKKHHRLLGDIFEKSLQGLTHIGTSSDFGNFVNLNGEKEHNIMKNDLDIYRKISVNSKDNIYNLKSKELNVF